MGLVWIAGMGGFVGAALRYGLSTAATRCLPAGYPYGTLGVNVLGCLAIGAVLGLTRDQPALSENARVFWVVGLLGSFTTFSTFGHETLALWTEAMTGRALLHVGLHLFLGLCAVALGAACME